MPVYRYTILDENGLERYEDYFCAANDKDAQQYADLMAERNSDRPSCRFIPKFPTPVHKVLPTP